MNYSGSRVLLALECWEARWLVVGERARAIAPASRLNLSASL